MGSRVLHILLHDTDVWREFVRRHHVITWIWRDVHYFCHVDIESHLIHSLSLQSSAVMAWCGNSGVMIIVDFEVPSGAQRPKVIHHDMITLPRIMTWNTRDYSPFLSLITCVGSWPKNKHTCGQAFWVVVISVPVHVIITSNARLQGRSYCL